MAAAKQHISIGKLLVQEKLISQKQLEYALAFQKKRQNFKLLGQICVELKLVTQTQLDEVLNKHRIVILGELLVQEKLLTREQLSLALKEQKTRKVYKPLGEICLEMKFITRKKLNEILDKYHKRIQLGQLLINLGLVSEEQFFKAIERQKKGGGQIGKILVQIGAVTESSLVNALSIQMGVPKVAPDPNLIDRRLLDKVSKEFLLKREILPAFQAEGVMTVITSNPLEHKFLEDLARVYNCKVEPAIASSNDIINCLKQIFALKKKPQQSKQEQLETKKDLIIGDAPLSAQDDENVVNIVNYVFSKAVNEKASDIHIEPEETRIRVRLRIDGILRHITDLPSSIGPSLTSRIKVICGLDISEKRKHQDGRISARIIDSDVDFRVSTYPSAWGENIVFRILHRQTHLVEINSLGFSPVNLKRIQGVLDQPSGIILVTGPTGSGKTTTLYACLNYLNNGERSIITVEDPIEYAIPGIVQGQLDEKIGQSYEDFLKSMMRQDPDVIMVGEVRESTGAEAVIQAALTGHKVLSTFHTEDSTGALLRLMDMGIDTFLISSTVVSVIAQRLVRILCPFCREKYKPDPMIFKSFQIREVEEGIIFYQPVGCDNCGNTGFRGRIAIHEMLLVNDLIRDAILARKTSSQIRNIASRNASLISIREDGFYKATQGITSLEEILRVVFYSEDDESQTRTAQEIIDLCEGKTPPPPLEIAAGESMKEPTERPIPAERQMSNILSLGENEDLSKASHAQPCGEVYRIRFDAATIGAEFDRLSDFFKNFQKLMDSCGRQVENEKMEDFARRILAGARRFEADLRADFLEFVLEVSDGTPHLVMETMVPEPQLALPHISREQSLRLVNFLMPSSIFAGEEPLLSALPESGRELAAAAQKSADSEESSTQLKRHQEEIDLSPYLGS